MRPSSPAIRSPIRAAFGLFALCACFWGWKAPALAEEASAAVAVKRGAPCTVDGSPSDWTGQQAAQTVLRSDGQVAATFKLSYDSRALYALVRVTDDSPLRNGATIREELLKGGDAVGLCFGPADGRGANQRFLVARLDGKPFVLAMRPTWPEKRPYRYFTRAAGAVAMDFVGEAREVEAALQVVAGGYAVELAIPWKTLGVTPADGLRLPFDLQVIFSDPAGTTNASTTWWHSTGTGPSATMDIATEAQLYPGAWGRLALGAPPPTSPPHPDRPATGPATATETAADDGVPVTFELPRDATTSLIIVDDHDWVVCELLRAVRLPQGRHTVRWDGRDRSGHPMPPGNYRFRLGFFDRIRTSFYGSVGNSGRPVFHTEDGLGSIGGTHGGPAAVAADDDGVYMLNSVEEGQKCLRKVGVDGKAKWFASTGVFGTGKAVAADGAYACMIYQPVNQASLLACFDAHTGRPVAIGAKPGPMPLPKVSLRGLAVIGDKAYIAWLKKNQLMVINLTTGERAPDIPVPAPTAICRGNGTDLLVCSETSILRVNTATGAIETVLDGLVAPAAVAIDRAGNLYVSDLGACQQIKKFSPAGKPLAAFGTPGGRPLAVRRYDPMQFRDVTGLAVGPDGNLWLVEKNNTPRRFARITPEGRWLEDFYGPTGYGVVGVDLDDPSTIYYQAISGGTEYVEAKIDYAAYARDPGNPVGAWRVEAIHNFTQNGLDKTATPDLMSKASAIGYNRALAFTATNGKRYFWLPGGEWCGLWLWEDAAWKPVAAVRTRPAESKSDYHAWADANGDGLVQPEETTTNAPALSCVWIDRDLTLQTGRSTLRPASVDARGVPSYAGSRQTSDVKLKVAPFFDQANYAVFGAPRAADGSRYLLGNVGPDRGLSFWDRAMETRLVKFKDNRAEWVIGHHDGRFRNNGDNVMLMNLAGELDGVVLAAEVNSNFTAYTTDGLTLGWVCGLDDSGRWQDFGPTALYVENVQPGLFIKDPRTGKRLLFAISTEDVRVLEVDGIFGDQITRVEGTLALRSALARRREGSAAPLPPGRWSIPYSTWAVTSGNRFIGVDGYDWEWSGKLPILEFYREGVLTADVRLRRDAGMLCVFADVLDATPFDSDRPEGARDPAEGIELLLGPVEPAGRTAPVAGDTAILLTANRENGEWTGLAQACRPASAPLDTSPSLRPLSSWGEFTGTPPAKPIDFRAGYAAIPGASVKVRGWLDGRGYSLEAEIPLALLPELAEPAQVTVKRQMNVNHSRRRHDASGPFRFNAIVRTRDANGDLNRLAWTAGAPGADPRSMRPADWGVVNEPVAAPTNDPPTRGAP